MDSQHRHELKENALLHWLDEKYTKIKPQLPMTIFVLAAVLVGWAAWSSLQRSNDQIAESSWGAFTAAANRGGLNLSDLEDIAEDPDFVGTDVEQWAKISLAEGKLAVASTYFIRNAVQANEALADAEPIFRELAGSSSADEQIRGRAQYGLARLLELQGELDKAQAAYEQVTGPFAEIAKERAEQLTTGQAAKDWEWLIAAKRARTGELEGPGTPGERPDASPDDLELPAEEATAEETVTEMLERLNAASGEDEAADDEAADDEAADEATGDEVADGIGEAGEETPATEEASNDEWEAEEAAAEEMSEETTDAATEGETAEDAEANAVEEVPSDGEASEENTSDEEEKTANE